MEAAHPRPTTWMPLPTLPRLLYQMLVMGHEDHLGLAYQFAQRRQAGLDESGRERLQRGRRLYVV